MKIITFYRIFAFVSISIVCSSNSYSQTFTKQSYTVVDGLPDSYIFNMKSDPYGFLWVGTPQGLSRFNGKEFVNYGYAEGLPDLRVDAIFFDRKNRLWVGTRKGMGLFTGKKFLEYPTNDSLPITFVFDFIETQAHQIWALTDVGVYEFAGNIWKKLNLYNGYENKAARSIIDTDSGQYINYGFVVVFKNTKGVYKEIVAKNDFSIYYDRLIRHKDKLYLSTTDGLLDISTSSHKKILESITPKHRNFVFCIDHKGRVWINSRDKGLWVCKENGSEKIEIENRNPLGESLLSGISEDLFGNIWLAGNEALVRITETSFKSYQNFDHSGANNYINDIYYDASGSLIVNNNSYRPYDFYNNTFVAKPYQNEKELIQKNNIFVVDRHQKDGKGRLWLVTRHFQLLLQDGNKLLDLTDSVCALNNEITDVIYDSARGKMITCGGGLCIGDENGFTPFVFSNKPIIKEAIIRLFRASNGIIYFATLFGKIYSLDQKGVCKLQLSEFNSLNWICRFFEDKNGAVWIIYQGRGVRKYLWRNEKLVPERIIVNDDSQLADNVSFLCFDSHNRIWAVLPDGMVVLARNKAFPNSIYRVVSQFQASQLGITDFIESKLLTDSSGNIWLTTTKKVFQFDISKLEFHSVKPSVIVEDILINLKETEWNDFPFNRKGLYQLPDSFQLSYQYSSIGFYFKAALQNAINDFKYSYRLMELDTVWSQPSSGNYVSFVNLPAGEYHFIVKARNKVSEWSDPVVFSFVILPPFWERWWFRLALVLAFALFIIYIFRNRINKIREEAAIQNQLRELELKALKAQMNPHFIYNALNSIQALVSGDKKTEAIKYIGSFSRLLRQVLEYSDKNVISLEKELETLRLYIQLESLRLDMNLNYRETIAEQVVTEFEKIPPLLLQPFIENALWHGLSRKKGDKKLELSIAIDNDWLICRVIDNGVGLQNAAEWNANNIRIGKSMASSINYNRLLQYNRTEYPLPLEYMELTSNTGEVSGTCVVLHIKRSSSN